MADKAKRACPYCGDEEHVYAKADIRWQPETQSWEVGDCEDLLECTECDETFYASEAGLPAPVASIGERAEMEALAAMCLWEAVVAPDNDDPVPWHDDRECSGTCYLRSRILGMAAQCDADWRFAQERMGFDDSFDWEFAPQWLRHNYGNQFATAAERLAWLA